MKMYKMYVCETCNMESRWRSEIRLCEAKHMGLTNLEDMDKYESLRGNVTRTMARRSLTNNEHTRKAEDEAYTKLLAFEKEYNMKV